MSYEHMTQLLSFIVGKRNKHALCFIAECSESIAEHYPQCKEVQTKPASLCRVTMESLVYYENEPILNLSRL